ncbi:MAG: hypothetical protein K2P81_11810, partial [Bacteriovoracaceae bacterium]|nr:hypothetical protein [Bacteriovoracaceae bacterium]
MRLLVFLILSFLAISCGKEQGATSLEVTLAALNANASGEIFLIAKNQTTGVIRREKLISDPQTLEIPNGVWEFHVVFFDGGITGTPKCGMDVQTLTGA